MVRVEESHPRDRGFASRDQQDLFSAFERGGDGWRAGTRGEGQARWAGTKYFDVRGGGLSASSGTDTFESVQHQLRTRDDLPVNNSLRHKTHILFLWL